MSEHQPAPVSPAEEPLSCQPVTDNCSACGKPLGESGHIHTCSPSRETTQREEWVVQYLTEYQPVWVDSARHKDRDAASRDSQDLAAAIGRPVRLEHRVITSRVVEGPTDA